MPTSRRNVLRFLSVAAAALSARASADVLLLPPGVHDIGLTDLPIETVRQECEQWCWAASLETIFSTWGYNVPQEVFAESLFGLDDFGNAICAPASDTDMLNAISQTFTAGDGTKFRGSNFLAKGSETHPLNKYWWEVVAFELSHKRPLLGAYKNGDTSGHAVVISHIRVQKNYDGSEYALAVTVRDPWPHSPNKRILSLTELNELRFVAAVSVKEV